MKIIRVIFNCSFILAIITGFSSCGKEVSCGKCYGKGEIPESTETCHSCNGSGEKNITCSTCKGEKQVRNTGSYGANMRSFISRPSIVECPSCNGYGHKKSSCSTCEGLGKTKTPQSTCDVCEGEGVFTPTK